MTAQTLTTATKHTTTSRIATTVNSDVKKEAMRVIKGAGLTMAEAMRIMVTKIATEHALPFRPEIPNKVTIAAMKESRSKTTTSFKTVEELMADLNA